MSMWIFVLSQDFHFLVAAAYMKAIMKEEMNWIHAQIQTSSNVLSRSRSGTLYPKALQNFNEELQNYKVQIISPCKLLAQRYNS